MEFGFAGFKLSFSFLKRKFLTLGSQFRRLLQSLFKCFQGITELIMNKERRMECSDWIFSINILETSNDEKLL